jgi:hypothetical protein
LNTGTDSEDGPSANHHHSHRHLLTDDAVAVPAPVDAIIVPTARPVVYLRKAVALARHHRCTLVALCSLRASAAETIKLAEAHGVDVLAVNIQDLPAGLVPQFETSAVLDSEKYGNRFSRRTDTSLKRNLGLLLAHVAGWQRIVFLDDDIDVPRPEDLNKAVGLLSAYAGVGLTIDGYPDNSVVCHAYRDAGGMQDTFIGGGALAVGRESFTSFFPNIYNEDWFFLLNETGLQPSAVIGRAVQARYDPYRETMRARSEELGDSLAEGLFGLLDTGKRLTAADTRYWRRFLSRRRAFIDEVIAMTTGAVTDPADRTRMIAALKAAKGRSMWIEPGMCVDYMEAWRADRKLWERHVQMFPSAGLEKCLAGFGLMHCFHATA